MTPPKHMRLPVKADEYGMYVWDADHHMLLDAAHVGSHDRMQAVARFAARALNGACGHGERPGRLDGIAYPVRVNEAGTEIVDAAGALVLRVRGWGRLQYLGETAGIEAQRNIGIAFAEAINATTA